MPTPFAPMGQQSVRFAKQYQSEWMSPADPPPAEGSRRVRRWVGLVGPARPRSSGADQPGRSSPGKPVRCPIGRNVGTTRPAS